MQHIYRNMKFTSELKIELNKMCDRYRKTYIKNKLKKKNFYEYLALAKGNDNQPPTCMYYQYFSRMEIESWKDMLIINDNSILFFEDFNEAVHEQYNLFSLLILYNKELYIKLYKIKIIEIFFQKFCAYRGNKMLINFINLLTKFEYYKLLSK